MVGVLGILLQLRFIMEQMNTARKDYPMKYIRPRYDKRYYSYLLCLIFLCASVFWIKSYVDEQNMVNNGFVNRSAVTFEVEPIEAGKKVLIEHDSPFILFQYNPSNPKIKYVWMNGHVKLPPLTMADEKEVVDYADDIAITGQYMKRKVPVGYQEVGHFNTPNSYALSTEMWLIPQKLDITIAKGKQFTLVSPNHQEQKIIEETFKEDAIKILNKDMHGTYILYSNQFVNYALFLALPFLVIIYAIITSLWMSKEKYYIHILYLSGIPILKIYQHIVHYKILPHTILTIGFIPICLAVQKYIYPLWSANWVLQTLYLVLGLNMYLLIASYVKVYFYSVKKGGKRF